MPVPPRDLDYFDKVNYVIDAWSRPCDAPWYIYVSTLKPALLKAFITLLTFGWDDVARGYLRPRGLGGRRTTKRKGKFVRGVPRFPEIGELIGRSLPNAEEVKGKRWSTLTKSLWRIDSVVQGALFAWLVADVTVDFFFEWTSVLYETRWCQASSLGRFSYHATDNHLALPNRQVRVHYNVEDYEFAPPDWRHGEGGTGGVPCTIAATVTLTPEPGEPPPTEITIAIYRDSPREVIWQSGPDPVIFPDDITAVVSGDLPPSTVFVIQIFHNGGVCRITDGIVTGMEDPN